MSIRFSTLLAGLGLGLALAMCPLAHAGKAVIVAQSIDLSGPNGSIGRDYVAGITTYFDSVNQKGGINGRKVQYLVRDDHGVAAEAAANVTALIKDDHADYLLGAIGNDATRAIAAAPAFAQSHHVLFAPLADSSASSDARVVFWRPSIESELLFLLSYFEKLGVKQVGIALQASPQNNRAFQFLSAEMHKRRMTLSGVANIVPNKKGLQQEALRLSQAGAKLVISIGDTIGSAQFLRAFRAYDAATFVAGTSLINLTTLSEIAGARATEFTVFSQVVPNPSSTVSALQSEHVEMMKRFRDEPVSSVTLEGFAVAKTLVRMMKPDPLALPASRTPIDLGGMTVVSAQGGQNLSRYVDIALFKRGGGLMF
ncbi:ABC transporter substrate-binding protein [Massilia sp. TSP1-1-2]|uniref:ABC transporter substrate-binding protein n=1 Tax=Massilia sp. TSP1-1-2 TaxID=2804649 RepID=UPI003CF60B23